MIPGKNQKGLGLNLSSRRTRKQTLLEELDQVMSWCEVLALVTPHALVARTVRPPFDPVMMLRIQCLQQWFGLSDLGISGTQRIPDRFSILRFRHLFEEHDLSPRILHIINAKLAAHGLLLKVGTVVDATLNAAPGSPNSSTGQRDPEMHQVKKDNQVHFGMEAHIGVDADTGLVHTVIGTAANVNDVTQGHGLLHGEESVVFADVGYRGASKRPEATSVQWQVAIQPGKRKAQKHTPWGALSEQADKLKASIQAKVEHPLRVIKRQFGHFNVRHRALKKNTAQLITLLALSNIWMARARLLRGAQG